MGLTKVTVAASDLNKSRKAYEDLFPGRAERGRS
jgi:hypothetical protein